jgi:tRNA/tmRNA/rRNA uracil-C5-methylase (TrmA/RlmC/RlmD family)
LAAHRLVVEKWVAGGWGMGRLADGRVVFCPGSLPGDVVECETLRRRRGVDWAENLRLLEPGPGRMEPSCPHFGPCGGCSLLHATPEREAELLEAMVADVLQRQAGLALPARLFSLPRPASRFRGKWQLGGALGVGYHGVESNHLQPVQDCLILPDCLRRLLPSLQERVRRLELEGELYFAAVPNGQIVLELLCRQGKGRAFAAELARWPGVVGVWFEGRCQGLEAVFPDWRGERPALRPRTFFQSNPESWPLFWQCVEHFQQQSAAHSLWDAHAGSGFLSLAWRGGPVHATEPEQHAFANLQAMAACRPDWRVVREQAAATFARAAFDLHALDAVLPAMWPPSPAM